MYIFKYKYVHAHICKEISVANTFFYFAAIVLLLITHVPCWPTALINHSDFKDEMV